MPQKLPHQLYLVYFLLFFASIYSQTNSNNKLPVNEILFYNVIKMADVGQSNQKKDFVLRKFYSFSQNQLKKKMENFAFTSINSWGKIEIKNYTSIDFKNKLHFKFIKSIIKLYAYFPKCDISDPKALFKINRLQNAVENLFHYFKDYGTELKVQLTTPPIKNQIHSFYFKPFVYGVFYGTLLITTILSFIFFLRLKELTFLWYSFYLFFIGLILFSIDCYNYKFITLNRSFFFNYLEFLVALLTQISLIKYFKAFTNLKLHCRRIDTSFNMILGFMIVLSIAPYHLPLWTYGYLFVNILGMITILFLTISVISLRYNKIEINRFFSSGILFLGFGILILILHNFSLVSDSFFTRNAAKFGTFLEIIFLFLAMTKIIKNLKENQIHLSKINLEMTEEVINVKTNLLSSISHELRTPLNAILNLTEDISKETINPKIKKNSKIIKYSSANLLNLINNVLDYYKIETEELIINETSFFLEKELYQIQKNAKMQARQKRLEFEYSVAGNISTKYLGDPKRLNQVLNIVLSNALKYTQKGKIKFHVASIPQENNKIKLTMTIADTGIGIRPEELQTIFTRINLRNTDIKKKIKGLGLGLYVAKKIIEMRKGNIQIESALGIGTTCTITINLTIDQTPITTNSVRNHNYDLKGSRILVIEDNSINQLVIKKITKNWLNTSVSFANNGQLGIDELNKNKYDLILMDLQMPVMDGYEATIAIRNGSAGSNNAAIPIIAVTADVMEQTKRKIKEIGMNHYLSKPVDNDTLYTVITNLLKKK